MYDYNQLSDSQLASPIYT